MQTQGHSPCSTGLPSFCRTCTRYPQCQAARLGIAPAVEKLIPCRQGDYLYRDGMPYGGIYAVQSGMAKTIKRHDTGREQVLAFHLPGEIFGLDAQRQREYGNAAIALERTWFCRFPATALENLNASHPRIGQRLRQADRRLRQRYLLRASEKGGTEQRLAGFLLDLHERRREQGLRLDYLPLPMSRIDIASYLDMSAETVSRCLAYLQKRALIVSSSLTRLHLINEPGLRSLSAMA